MGTLCDTLSLNEPSKPVPHQNPRNNLKPLPNKGFQFLTRCPAMLEKSQVLQNVTLKAFPVTVSERLHIQTQTFQYSILFFDAKLCKRLESELVSGSSIPALT
jgi:hypothetical protein